VENRDDSSGGDSGCWQNTSYAKTRTGEPHIDAGQNERNGAKLIESPAAYIVFKHSTSKVDLFAL